MKTALEHFEGFLKEEHILYETGVDLKTKTWIHRGGSCDYYVKPHSIDLLTRTMSFLYQHNIPHFIIGCSSNLYILNSTNIPVVISTLQCNSYNLIDNYIECDCGLQVAKLAKIMVNTGIKGFEYLTKLPGTIGAAIYNNSSCKNNSISGLLIDLDLLTPDGIIKIQADDLHFGFRSSDLKKHVLKGTILQARLRAEYGDKNELIRIAKENEASRRIALEGPAQNLGCTVNRLFYNGEMPLRFRLPYRFVSKVLSLFVKDEMHYRYLKKVFLLTITGHKRLIPYVSDKQFITFIWKDEKADDVFCDYLVFMRDVFKTDQIEIEIIR